MTYAEQCWCLNIVSTSLHLLRVSTSDLYHLCGYLMVRSAYFFEISLPFILNDNPHRTCSTFYGRQILRQTNTCITTSLPSRVGASLDLSLYDYPALNTTLFTFRNTPLTHSPNRCSPSFPRVLFLSLHLSLHQFFLSLTPCGSRFSRTPWSGTDGWVVAYGVM